MALEEFVAKKFTGAHKQIIRQANQIIDEYMDLGFSLTLRSLYYQFVARDLMQNDKAAYKRLGAIIDAGRKAGLIDWDAIEDRTRNIRRIPVWETPEDAVQQLRERFKLDPWEEQTTKRRIEVWIEKDALVGAIESVCNRYRVPYFSCRGYGSSSELYAAGKRLAYYRRAGYETLVLHLGDHDPSGVQMSEDNQDRIDMYARQSVELRRIALTMDQIRQYNPPPNFAKQTDSRTKWYVETFKTEDAWELDALSPDVIDKLIESHIKPLINEKEWAATMKREEEHLAVLEEIISGWDRTKAAPAMLRLLKQHAFDYSVTAESNDDGDYEHDDSACLGMMIDESVELISKFGLRDS